MMSETINTQLHDLAGLWMDPSSENLRQILAACDDLTASAISGATDEEMDPALLRRVQMLAGRAEKRLADCLAIQIRTGSYSVRGDLELASRVATSGWEG